MITCTVDLYTYNNTVINFPFIIIDHHKCKMARIYLIWLHVLQAQLLLERFQIKLFKDQHLLIILQNDLFNHTKNNGRMSRAKQNVSIFVVVKCWFLFCICLNLMHLKRMV